METLIKLDTKIAVVTHFENYKLINNADKKAAYERFKKLDSMINETPHTVSSVEREELESLKQCVVGTVEIEIYSIQFVPILNQDNILNGLLLVRGEYTAFRKGMEEIINSTSHILVTAATFYENEIENA